MPQVFALSPKKELRKATSELFSCLSVGCTPRGSCNNTRLSEGFSEGACCKSFQCLVAPMRLRVQSRSRRQSTIAAYSVFSFPACFNQRAENGGLDPSWLIFGFFGAPRFSVQRSQNAYFKGVLWPLDGKPGRPKNAKINHDGSNPPFSTL